jgi:hypothetical protein
MTVGISSKGMKGELLQALNQDENMAANLWAIWLHEISQADLRLPDGKKRL